MKWGKMSHIGLVRKNNEDNCCVCDDINLFAVADGMGGHKAGEIASRLALDELTSYLRINSPMLDGDPAEALRQAVYNANAAVLEFARTDGEKFRGMGTTITAAVYRENKIYVAHVGDSRAYLVRGEKIRLLTSDHSLVNELVKSGGITPE
ncbi:MAG TPA: protein phosphatase 2C domain-containing protein, partial [Desulfobacteria bacterium]|nr:protein phosphatase 2C domain-containing protein [Desulfobacteria bacterium]